MQYFQTSSEKTRRDGSIVSYTATFRGPGSNTVEEGSLLAVAGERIPIARSKGLLSWSTPLPLRLVHTLDRFVEQEQAVVAP